LRVGSPLGSLLCLLTISLHTLLILSCELLGRGWYYVGDLQVHDTGCLTSLSIDGE
jgi:hypothetical protein